MPMANGKYARTFGEGYAREKAAQPPTDEVHSDSGGAEMLIKDNEDGSYETKSKRKGEKHRVEEAEPMRHESAEEMKEHVDSHFAGDSHEAEPGDGSDGSEEEGGNALKSILSE